MRSLDSIIDSGDMKLSQLLKIQGQKSLACCSPWGLKELDMTQRLNKQQQQMFIQCLLNAQFLSYHCIHICHPAYLTSREGGSGSRTVMSLCPEYSCLFRACQLAPQWFFPIKGFRVHSALEVEALSWWSIAAQRSFLHSPPQIITQPSFLQVIVQHNCLKGLLK